MKEMSQYDIVTYLLNTNEELYETYQIYQSILYSIDTRNKNIFLSIINDKNLKVSKVVGGSAIGVVVLAAVLSLCLK